MDRSTWVEISAAGLRSNLEAVQAASGVPVCAVVKANAYGHGLLEAARVLAGAGASMLAVTRIEEARRLREDGIAIPILIMMPVSDPSEATALDCDITIGSVEEIAALPADAKVHLKIDTGMGRLGVPAGDAYQSARAITERASLEAVWTHFPDAAGPGGRVSLERFRSIVTALRHDGIGVPAHAANSAALCALPESTFDMVRIGTLLYGQDPAGAKAPFPLAETFAWQARVLAVRTLEEGATVGYGSEWRASKRTRVGTIGVGYADGFAVEPVARTPSPGETAKRVAKLVAQAARGSRREVFFGDRSAPVLGRVAMQAITVSLEGLPDVDEGSVARIPARRLMVDPTIERVIT